MKKILLAAALLAVSAGAFAQSQPAANTIQSIPVGTELPDAGVELRATDGATVTLDGEKTKHGLIVMFSCNTCPYVIKAQQRTKEVMALAKKKGLGMVVINSNEAQRGEDDAPQAMKEYAAAQRYTVPYVIDKNSRLANDFGATRTPEVFLFNSKGVLVYKGALEDNPSDPASSKKLFLADAVSNMLAGKKVDPAETKSIGCSIKRMQR